MCLLTSHFNRQATNGELEQQGAFPPTASLLFFAGRAKTARSPPLPFFMWRHKLTGPEETRLAGQRFRRQATGLRSGNPRADTPRAPRQGREGSIGAASHGRDVSAGRVGCLRGTPLGFHGALPVSRRLVSYLAHLGLTAGFRLDGPLAAWTTNAQPVADCRDLPTCPEAIADSVRHRHPLGSCLD